MTSCAAVVIAALDLRRGPDHRSELRSQLLLGELVRVISRTRGGSWCRVENRSDGYRGWVRAWGLRDLTADEAETWSATARWRVARSRLEVRSRPGSGRVLIPLFWNSRVACGQGRGDHREVRLPDGTMGWAERRGLRRAGGPAGTLDRWVREFRGTPYLWGGRTPGGFDCSGFVQQTMAVLGFCLPRDAHDQFLACRRLSPHEAPKRGDLVFFGRVGTRLAHVGIVLGRGLYAHARGSVRVSSLSPSNRLYDHDLARMVRAVARPRKRGLRGSHSC